MNWLLKSLFTYRIQNQIYISTETISLFIDLEMPQCLQWVITDVPVFSRSGSRSQKKRNFASFGLDLVLKMLHVVLEGLRRMGLNVRRASVSASRRHASVHTLCGQQGLA
jgi:hypothetical protein